MSTALSKTERAALVRCRASSRFDPIAKEYGSTPTQEQRAEEERATLVRIPHRAWARLVHDRFVTVENNRYRLTHAGWAALQEAP